MYIYIKFREMTKQKRIEALELEKEQLLKDIYLLIEGEPLSEVVIIKKKYIQDRHSKFEKSITDMFIDRIEKIKGSEQY